MIIKIEDPRIFIGLTYGAAVAKANEQGYTAVLLKSEGIPREIIRDYDPLRVLLITIKNIVTEAKIA